MEVQRKIPELVCDENISGNPASVFCVVECNCEEHIVLKCLT